MYIRKCDKCGAEQHIATLVPFFGVERPEEEKKPRINITVLDAENLREITLCWDCERKLTDWLGISLAEDDNGEDDK